jgi:hypothetical protein
MNEKGWAKLPIWDGISTMVLNERHRDLLGTDSLRPGRYFLRPKSRADAKRGTMSSVTGLGPQPPHTDGAHLVSPPRYIALRCDAIGAEPCPTVLWSLDKKALTLSPPKLLLQPGWVVRRSASMKFYSQVLEFMHGGLFRIRFDPICMSLPSMPNAIEEVWQSLIANSIESRFEWSVGDTILIDNWRTLHARGSGADGALLRQLSRWTSGDL